MAVGYGDCDDPSLHAEIRVEERVALIRSTLPKGLSAQTCRRCGCSIPEGRQTALPGVQHCVNCVPDYALSFKAKETWAV